MDGCRASSRGCFGREAVAAANAQARPNRSRISDSDDSGAAFDVTSMDDDIDAHRHQPLASRPGSLLAGIRSTTQQAQQRLPASKHKPQNTTARAKQKAERYRFVPKGGATLMPNGQTIDEMWNPVEKRARGMDTNIYSGRDPLPPGKIHKLWEAVGMNMPYSKYDYKRSLPNVGGWSDREKAANYQYYIMGRRAGVPDVVLRKVGIGADVLDDLKEGKYPDFKEDGDGIDIYDRAKIDLRY